MNVKSIKLIRGKPYNPHSQGVVERVHVTIRKALNVNFLDNNKDYNLDIILPKVVNRYNNTIHTITKYSPNEFFYSSNEELHKKVYMNILDYYKKKGNNSVLFKIRENVY